MSDFEIIKNVILPDKIKIPGRPKKLSDEERKIRRKILVDKHNRNKTKEQVKEANRKQREKNTESFRQSIKKAKIKIAAKREIELAAIAGRPRPKLCEVCNDEGKICFDHCHKTNKFRGWFCDPCNRILGQAKDNPIKLDKLAEYLRKF